MGKRIPMETLKIVTVLHIIRIVITVRDRVVINPHRTVVFQDQAAAANPRRTAHRTLPFQDQATAAVRELSAMDQKQTVILMFRRIPN